MKQPTTLVSVDEYTFAQRVLAAPLPTIVLFGTPTCPATHAYRQLLHEQALYYAGALRIAVVDVEQAIALGEQVGIAVTPTLLIVQNGDICTRVIGFMPPGLLQLLCEQIVTGTLPIAPLWCPNEELFEERVIVPLLETWGVRYWRQAPCPAPARGRIDMLIYDHESDMPLTLFENKRHLASPQALIRAMQQAYTYARALQLGSFVVAAPPGLWIYACTKPKPSIVQQITSLALLHSSQSGLDILRQLRYDPLT